LGGGGSMDKPYILMKDGIIIDVNNLFLELSCYNSEDLKHKPFGFIWKDLLRISVEPGFTNGYQEAYLFTKSLEARHIDIKTEIQIESNNNIIYTFLEKPQSRLENIFLFIENLYFRGTTGVAIYSIPDLILLKANQVLLNFLDKPYNDANNSIGKNAAAIISGFKGSMLERNWHNVIKTGEVFDVKEMPYKGFKRGTTHWNMRVVPISEDGDVQYLIQTVDEITHTVLNRKKMEKQAEIIKQQKEQLEVIIENMTDALCVIDNKGNFLRTNKAFKRILGNRFQSNPEAKNVDDTVRHGQLYCDENGKALLPEELPPLKVLKGERVEKQRVMFKDEGKEIVVNTFATPIFDENGELQYGILLGHDITDVIENKKLISKQKEDLEASIELKDEFLYLITHEFRTPMAVISSALQVIELMYRSEISEKVGRYLKMIKQNTNRQLRLVNNLLDITRISSGSIKMNMSSFDIVNVVQTIVNSVQLYGQQKQVAISFNSTLEKKDIFSDEEKIERILLNLLSNALKFTQSEKSINVTLSAIEYKDKSMISISVKDEGIGIPEEKQKVIFDRFGQVDSSLSRRAEGTGLGLHLVKLMVNALDGETILRSEVGRGSTFTVLLPVRESIASIEEATSDEMNLKLMSRNDRVIESVVIEFSDIYF
jgi:signal transduction histidine kinase